MRRNAIVPADWRSCVGTETIDRDFASPTVVNVEFITQGATFLLFQDGQMTVLACQRGSGSFSVVCDGQCRFAIEGWTPDDRTSVKLPWSREELECGWHGGESMAQLELKPADQITPEMQAIFDRMNANAARREAKLKAQIQAMSSGMI